MAKLVEEGKVRWLGVCNFPLALIERIECVRHVDSVQPPLNMIERKARDDVLPWANEHGSGVLAYSPMASGLLSGTFQARLDELSADDWRRTGTAPAAWKFKEPHLSRALELVKRIRQVADRLGLTVGALAIGWVLALPGVTGAIVGARRPDQVDGWLPAARVALDEEALAELEEAIAEVVPEPGPPSEGFPLPR
jgi:aryl-alcohol dehydrogenase-like predicted oxidoreductase